jgi:hypothetical protein
MKIPRVCLRITAYHIVDASLGALILCHGGPGSSVTASTSPASRS